MNWRRHWRTWSTSWVSRHDWKIQATRISDRVILHVFSTTWEVSMLQRSTTYNTMETYNFVCGLERSHAVTKSLHTKNKDRQQSWVNEVRNIHPFTSYRYMDFDPYQVITTDDFQDQLIGKRVHHYPQNMNYGQSSYRWFSYYEIKYFSIARSMIQNGSRSSYSM